MFSEFRYENFKSYREAEFPLAPLTLLIGTNASGKSNALEGIRFLSWLSKGQRLDDALRAVQEDDVTIRGTLETLGYHGAGSFSLGCSLASTKPWEHFEVTLQIEGDDLYIVEESIYGDHSKVPLYEIVHSPDEYGYEVKVAYNNFARGGRKPQIACSNQRAILTQLDTPSRFGKEEAQEKIPDITDRFRRALGEILFLDPEPRRMREYSFANETELVGDGRNLSGVLYNLCQDADRKQEILDFIEALPEQDFQDISFIETPRSEVMVELTESFGGREKAWDAPILSDGTLRVLAVGAAVLSAPEGSLIAIEEIDNGVHPSRAGMLLENIQRIAEKRNLRVVLTSHNPALLDSLPDASVPHVVCCYRDSEEGDSRLVRLEDLRKYPDLVARGPLGRLMTRGIIEQYLHEQLDPKKQKEKDKAWLESVK
ncbi:AAA family ATPase [Salinibacter sp.]|jgi:predicted ATPase|uniref:AAA family ATPase n=1 Tax=Salinibacter sp. TaxID=2065818 RepID=UPI0021E708BC|nr:ATP-binding protein [Salinibacter sp.]